MLFLLYINLVFEQILGQIYPTEFQLNNVNSAYTEAPPCGLRFFRNKKHSFILIYDRWDDFNSLFHIA